jgi:hypothetical protein
MQHLPVDSLHHRHPRAAAWTTRALVFVLTLVPVSMALAQNAAPAPQTPPSATTAPSATATLPTTTPAVMHILQMLHDRDATLRDFTAKVRKEDLNVKVGDKEYRDGDAAYQKLEGVTKLGIHFSVLRGDDVPPTPLDEDLVFDGRHFIHRDGKAKTYSVQELVPAGENFNPLKLGAGPLPLPIGQDPAEILRDFTVTLEPVNAKDLPKGYKDASELTAIKLVPRVVGKYDFKSAVLVIDPKLELPIRIATVSRDDNLGSVTLTDVRVNLGKLKILDVPEPQANSGWTITREPYRGGPDSK